MGIEGKDGSGPAGAKHANLLWFGLSAMGLIVSVWFFGIVGPKFASAGYDAWAYWDVDLGNLYGRSAGQLTAFGAFRYSPPVAMALAPLGAVSWFGFLWVLTCLLVGTLGYLGGRWTLAVMAFPGVAISIYEGNIDLFLAASAAIGLLSPAAWAFALLSKPTMAVCLVWFMARGEWRKLAIALGITGAIALPTVILRPDLWVDYVVMLLDNLRLPTGQELGPLWIRLPLALVLTVVAARTDRPWLVGVAAALAQPLLGLRSATVAVAAVALWRWRAHAALQPRQSAHLEHSLEPGSTMAD
jgi:hypothetical protein